MQLRRFCLLCFNQSYCTQRLRQTPLTGGEKTRYEGSTVRSRGFKLGSPVRGDVPIFLAAMGPKMLELVGEVADVVEALPDEMALLLNALADTMAPGMIVAQSGSNIHVRIHVACYCIKHGCSTAAANRKEVGRAAKSDGQPAKVERKVGGSAHSARSTRRRGCGTAWAR